MRGLRQAPFYSASKAFLINLCQALSAKNKKEGIDIKILDIRPGFVATKMSGGSLWQCPVPKAAGQIIKGFSSQCSVVYISRRWALVGALIHFIPTWLWDRV
jgi:short-subunit dehydrogenase